MARTALRFIGPLLLLAGSVAAENIDPAHDASQYAYGENVGWLNAEPLGDSGPGVQVGDGELSGWMWGENIGWISLSCDNTLSCAGNEYRVHNDGAGALSGLAWTENAGWLSFSCASTASCASASYGVSIDPSTGAFAGRAWGENIGWVTFASSGAAPFGLRSGWICSPAPAAPAGSPRLRANRVSQGVVLSWTAVVGATGYDIVSGDLTTLLNSNGNFQVATTHCVDNDRTTTALLDAQNPRPGSGNWYLVRGQNCGGGGSYDSGASQSGSRDPGIAASSSHCD